MALEALKQYVAEHEKTVNDKIDSLLKNDPAECPTIVFKGQGNTKPLSDEKAVVEALQERIAGVYKQHQENIRQSGMLRTDITKGIQAGESLYNLLVKAVECISLMTGDTLFYTQNKTSLQTLYGIYRERAAIDAEWQEVSTRLEKLQQALDKESSVDGQRRIQTAIKAHQERLENLK